MSRLLLELENILQSLIEEHRKLSAHVSVQQNAMKTLQNKSTVVRFDASDLMPSRM